MGVCHMGHHPVLKPRAATGLPKCPREGSASPLQPSPAQPPMPMLQHTFARHWGIDVRPEGNLINRHALRTALVINPLLLATCRGHATRDLCPPHCNAIPHLHCSYRRPTPSTQVGRWPHPACFRWHHAWQPHGAGTVQSYTSPAPTHCLPDHHHHHQHQQPPT